MDSQTTYLLTTLFVFAVPGVLFLVYRLTQTKDDGTTSLSPESQARIALLKERLSKFSTEASKQNGLNFQPQPTDVIVTTYPKCGTTWTQQIVQQLRSRGNLNFEEINVVQPWLTIALDCGQDLNAPQEYEPRVFKSHLSYDDVPKGCKYIYILRDPVDVLWSFYKFLPPYCQVHDMTLEEFFQGIFQAGKGSRSGCIWDHYESWYPHRNDPNVCWLFFEDLKQDLHACVMKIATFLDLDPSDSQLIDMVVGRSGFAFMKQRESMFDEHVTYPVHANLMDLPGDHSRPPIGKVRAGHSGVGRSAITPKMVEYLTNQWMEQLYPLTGCRSYQALRERTSFLSN